jgi:hypothetical protein
MKALVSLLALPLLVATAGAQCQGPGCAAVAQTRTVTRTVFLQQAPAVVVQPAPVVIQPPPVTVLAGGCGGGIANVATTAGGCSGRSGGSNGRLFSGGLFHRSGAGLFAKHKSRHGAASAGYESTTTVRQWDNRPAAAVVVVPESPPLAPPKWDGEQAK